MPRAASCTLIICMFIIFFVICIPITLIIAILGLPYKLILMLTRKSIESKINVKVSEPSEGSNDNDDLLFIHGWPDCGEMWNDQVEVLSKEFKCIVVTMPNYDGNENH